MDKFDPAPILEAALRQAERLELPLDYTGGSAERLDEILEICAQEFLGGRLDDKQAWNLAVIFGTYLGETLLRNGLGEKGYHWELTDSGLPVLQKDAANRMSPITKADKSIQNGREDSVKSFYDVAQAIAGGRLKPGR